MKDFEELEVRAQHRLIELGWTPPPSHNDPELSRQIAISQLQAAWLLQEDSDSPDLVVSNKILSSLRHLMTEAEFKSWREHYRQMYARRKQR